MQTSTPFFGATAWASTSTRRRSSAAYHPKHKAIAELENDELNKAQILAKPIEMLTMSNTLIFNGGKIHREGMTIMLT
jgi:hypothetical protein